ncbi:MAG: hypothetical protein M3Y91_01925 [Actinomycetota bacterium]|nr:hypothetical protein [Actinomycetota bacterium]
MSAQPAWAGATEPDDEGGDPVCWADRVCPQCGTFADRRPPTVCPRCEAPITG